MCQAQLYTVIYFIFRIIPTTYLYVIGSHKTEPSQRTDLFKIAQQPSERNRVKPRLWPQSSVPIPLHYQYGNGGYML